MQVIEKTAVVTDQDIYKFFEKMNEIINNYQELGLEVEAQYRPFGNVQSVLLIGRKEKYKYDH